MDLTQVQEIVKTINVAFDGKLNSETLVQLSDKVMPYFWMIQIKGFIVHCIWALAIMISAWLIGKAIMKASKDV